MLSPILQAVSHDFLYYPLYYPFNDPLLLHFYEDTTIILLCNPRRFKISRTCAIFRRVDSTRVIWIINIFFRKANIISVFPCSIDIGHVSIGHVSTIIVAHSNVLGLDQYVMWCIYSLFPLTTSPHLLHDKLLSSGESAPRYYWCHVINHFR